MRLPGLSLRVAALVSVLGGCTETGAHLTLWAPEGPTTAASFRVVLAAHETIPTIRNQRVAAGDNHSLHDVSYFLQRTVAGASDEVGDGLDGLTVRIAPGDATDHSEFIPFVLVYDRAERIVGIGTYRAGEAALPSAILVKRDEIDKYTLPIEPVTQVGDMDAPAPGQVQVIECFRDDQSAFTSGLVWRPLRGGEYRIVLPADGGTDATGRPLDLDCDDHVVTAESSRPDCDDTRNWFHRDAEDVCDGYDTNCDGLQTLATSCDANVCTTGGTADAGVELCDDATGEALGCNPTASCSCQLGQGCNVCLMPYTAGANQGDVRPCQPAVGMLKTGKCSEIAPCTVEVVGVRTGWKIEIAASSSGSFGYRAENVGASFAVRAKHPESDYEHSTANGVHLVDVDFALITTTGTYYMGAEIKLDEDISIGGTCDSAPAMRCSP